MSLIQFLMSLGSMSHVDFKKGPYRHVEFRGQGPSTRDHGKGSRSVSDLQDSLARDGCSSPLTLSVRSPRVGR